MTAHHIDRAIEALARRQHGAFNRTQVRDLGASSSFIDRRLASGTWLRLAPSVYALPGNPSTFRRQCMAAVLAEPLACISGFSAAVLHELTGFRPGRIEITAPIVANHRNSFATVRRSDHVQVTRVDHIPVLTLEQTICDIARRLTTDRLEAVVDLALSTHRTTCPKLIAGFEALAPHARGRLRSLASMLELRSDAAYVPPTSVLEAALYRVLDHRLLPDYERQARLPWRADAPQRVDALIGEWRLIPEADGRAWHTRFADLRRDRVRDRDALAHGYEVARYVYDEFVGDTRWIVDELLRIGEMRCLQIGA